MRPICHILFLILLVGLLQANAQSITDGWMYGQAGRQTSHLLVIDNEDSRYNYFASSSPLTIDSLGVPIQVLSSNGFALVKFDRNGIYQNHVIIPDLSGGLSSPFQYLQLDYNNEILLATYCTAARDTVWLLNKNGHQLRHLFTPDTQMPFPTNPSNQGMVIIKFDKKLTPKWSTFLHKRNNRSHGGRWWQAINNNGLSINQTGSNEIMFNFKSQRNKVGTATDTLIYTNNAGQRQIVEVTTQDLVFKIDTNGNFISKHEPFINKLNATNRDATPHANGAGTRDFHILQHGNKCVFYRGFEIFTADTFKVNANIAIPMGVGYNVILAQWDAAADSFDWAYKINYDPLWFTYFPSMTPTPNYLWAFDPIKQELLFLAKQQYRANNSLNFLPSIFSNQELNDAEIHLVKINLSGNIVWENIYQNWFRIEEMYYYPHIKGFIIIGNSTSIDSVTFGHLRFKPISHHFMAVLDSNSRPYSIANISTTTSYSSFNVMLFTPNNLFTMNRYTINNTNSNGNLYITGYAERDSLVLRCRTLKATQLQDAFVLSISPITPIDTFSCSYLQSPSNRYVWDSSGIYYDTLQNVAGCDSIIRFNLSIGKSKSTIDSAVCYRMQSPSTRHLWESSGIYLDTIPNYLGCDSVITVRLTVKHTRDSITQSHCGIRPSPSGRFVMDTTGVYKDTLVNQFGCDSLLTIHFTQLRLTDTTLRDTLVCSYFITQYGDTIRNSSTISDTLQTALGCDSIVRYQIIIGDSTATIDTTICEQYLSPGGKLFTLAGTYADTIVNTNGCRLYYTIHISKTPLNASIDTTVCNTFVSPSGKLFNAPGTFTDTIQSTLGCDSIITFRIAKQNRFRLIDTAICTTYTSPSGRLVLNTSGNYFDTIFNPAGCDSVFEIRLTLDTFSVRITKSNDLTCETPNITLSADAGVRFLWQPSDFLNADNLQGVVSAPEGTIQYRLVAFSSIGCEARDSVTIEDKRIDIKLNIPNVFTPNGDNINDDFGIDPQDDVKQMHLQIYNRWGAKIFESHSPHIRWNGQASNGNECAAGVYYYIAKGIDGCGKPINLNGTVSLVR